MAREDLPVLVLFDGWTSFFPERVANWRMGLATKLREQLETIVAPKYIASQRWYAGKGTPIKTREPRRQRRVGNRARPLAGRRV